MLNRHELREWTKTILWSLVLFFGLRVAVVEAYHVPTGSMEPTIVPGDRVLGTKFHYWLFEPARGDVAVFKTPERVKAMSEHPSKRLVKRIVAIAGDTVEVRDGSLFVNGGRVEEPYLKDRPAYRMPAVVVPEGDVFVLGDNRNNSLDGHVWGFVEKDQLLARAWVKYWPPWHAGTL